FYYCILTLLSHLTSNSNNTNTTFSKDAMTYVLTHRLLMFCTTLAEPKKATTKYLVVAFFVLWIFRFFCYGAIL
ncbi:hypothetical protein, partial [Enterococcus faecium]|uniref:hypothetical protein n=1 Tax=Enterococcus faecium TaxID=1352 RepID=UPI001E583ADF